MALGGLDFGVDPTEIDQPPTKAQDALGLAGRPLERRAAGRGGAPDQACQRELGIVFGIRRADGGVGDLQPPLGDREVRSATDQIMGAAMAIIMLGFMRGMYKNRTVNLVIFAVSATVLAGSLWFVRSQETVDDVVYMQTMIPHHSIAIITSRRAHIKDPRVRELADGIIETPVREIGEMDALVAELKRRPPAPEAKALTSATH